MINAKKIEKWDVQHHIIPDFHIEEMKRQGRGRISDLSIPPWTVEKSLSMMKKWNVTRAILSISIPGVHFGDGDEARKLCRRCNEYLLKCVNDYPEKFGGFAALPLPDIEGSIAEIKYTLDEKQLDGVLLFSSVHGKYIGEPAFRPIFEELDSREAIVHVHPNTLPDKIELGLLNGFYWWYLDTTRAIISMIRSGFHRDFPRIKYIFAHGGGVLPAIFPQLIDQLKAEHPDIEAELEQWKSQIYLDTAKVVSDEAFASMLSFTDPEHILFASDFMWAKKMQYWTDEINKKGFDDEQLHNIYSENARRLFSHIPFDSTVNITKHKDDAPQKYKHYHIIPVCILDELKKLNLEIDVEGATVVNPSNMTNTIAMVGQDYNCIAIDIPEIWSLEQAEINRLLRLFNQELARISAQLSENIKGFGAIQIDDVQSAIEEIEYCTKTLKLDGLCIYVDLSDATSEETLHPLIIEKLASINMPIMVHPKDARGIPIENTNYLDASYFAAKILYSGEIQSLEGVEFILAHTCEIQQILADQMGVMYYMRHDGNRMASLMFDYVIRKIRKGETFLKTVETC